MIGEESGLKFSQGAFSLCDSSVTMTAGVSEASGNAHTGIGCNQYMGSSGRSLRSKRKRSRRSQLPKTIQETASTLP